MQGQYAKIHLNIRTNTKVKGGGGLFEHLVFKRPSMCNKDLILFADDTTATLTNQVLSFSHIFL